MQPRPGAGVERAPEPMDGLAPSGPNGFDVDRALARVARGGLLSGFGAAVSGVLSFVVVVAVTRGFPAGEAGSLFAATSVFLIVVAIVELGVDTGLLHWLPRYLVEGEWPAVMRCLRVALLPTFAVSVLGAALLAMLGPAFGHLTGDNLSSNQTVEMVRVMAPFVPITAIYELLLATTRAHRTMRATVLVEKVGRSLAQLATVIAAWVLGVSGTGLAIAWCLPYLPALAITAWYTHRLHKRVAPPVRRWRPPPPVTVVARGFWGYTLPRAGARICQVALQRADIVLVAVLLSPREAAIYTAATRFLVLGLLAVQAVQQVMQPHLSHALARGDRVGAGRLFQVSTVWITGVAWPPYLVMAVLAPIVLRAFGGGYKGGEGVLALLALTMLFATAAGPVDVVLTMAGRSGLSLFNSATSLVIDIGLDLVLIPRLGITGAAIGWAVAIVVRNVLPLVQIHRLWGFSAWSRGLSWVAASSLLCFGLGAALARMLAGPTTMALVITVPFAAIYGWLLWRGRERVHLSLVTGALRRRPEQRAAVMTAAR